MQGFRATSRYFRAMGPRSPSRIALITALLTSAGAGTGMHLLLNAIGTDAGLHVTVLLMGLVFILSLVITFLLVKRYVQEQVDLIHRTVHEVRGERTVGSALIGEDIGEEGHEVSAWAVEKRSDSGIFSSGPNRPMTATTSVVGNQRLRKWTVTVVESNVEIVP